MTDKQAYAKAKKLSARKRIYQTQIAATEPDKWRKVSAASLQDAAIAALRHVGPNAVNWPCIIYVGDPRYQHDNQTPIIVHAFTLQKGSAS